MSNLLVARLQMALSLGFHIVFAAVGMAMPLLMVLAELAWRRSRREEDLRLTRLWARGTAVVFAVGAVSGTVLSFELGLLFPQFMKHAGPVIGMPFSLEGFAFFTEAIFLGLYLYGRDRVSPRLHLSSAILVALSGVASAAFVTIANAWMNLPRGFRVERGVFVDIDPIAAAQTPFALHEVLHMVLAAYAATAGLVAALHAYALLRQPHNRLHVRALRLALWVLVPSALVQPLVGHYAGQQVARYQPLKLAALEQLATTQDHAPLHLGPLELPSGLSVMAFNRPAAVVQGLDAFPKDEHPPRLVRPAFLLMVLLGMVLAGHGVWGGFWLLRGRGRNRAAGPTRALLWATLGAGPLGFLALEAGWVVTEVGRQPWIIYGVMRTAAAVTPMPHLWIRMLIILVVYLGLAVVVTSLLRGEVRAALEPGQEEAHGG